MDSNHLITQSPLVQAALQSAMQVAKTDALILILGESGTGKERLARDIHTASPRKNQPFITVNCAALPSTLAESLLFGHTKGAFTGANEANPGLIAAADGGTLFFDEIGELPLNLQPKLLRFLEQSDILSLGKTRPQRVNIRVLAATHCNLKAMVDSGTFRADLFYRLNVIPLELPPLRNRQEDIESLMKYFLAHFARQHQQAESCLSDAALTLLQTYRWPGNIRELRNLCENLSILQAGREITPDNLLASLHPSSLSTSGTIPNNQRFILPDGGVKLDELESHLLHAALERTDGNKTKAAQLLGISRDALNYRFKKHTETS